MNIIDINTLNPDYMHIDPINADTQVKKEFISEYGESEFLEEYPILQLYRDKKDFGCYLFYQQLSENNIIPLYTGRTVSFYTRMHQHWSNNNSKNHFMNKFSELLDKFLDGKFNDFEPDYGDLKLCLWVISDKQKRIYKEHELISIAKPMFNRD